MLSLFKPGDVIYGYCNGYFGRDNYDTKTCVLVYPKFAVFTNEEGYGTVLNYDLDLNEDLVNKWKIEEEYE